VVALDWTAQAVVSVDACGSVRARHPDSGALLRSHKLPRALTAAFGGNTLAIQVSPTSIALLDVSTFRPGKRITVKRSRASLAVSADDRRLALTNSKRVVVVDLKTGRRHDAAIAAARQSAFAGDRLAVACDDGVRVLDLPSLNVLGHVPAAGDADTAWVTATPDGRQVLAGGFETLQQIDVADVIEVERFTVDEPGAAAVAGPKAATIVAADGSGVLHAFPGGRPKPRRFGDQGQSVTILAASPAGDRLAAASDGAVVLWGTGGQKVDPGPLGPARLLCVGSAGASIAVTDEGLWRRDKKGKPARVVTPALFNPRFCSDGVVVGQLHAWQATDGSAIKLPDDGAAATSRPAPFAGMKSSTAKAPIEAVAKVRGKDIWAIARAGIIHIAAKRQAPRKLAWDGGKVRHLGFDATGKALAITTKTAVCILALTGMPATKARCVVTKQSRFAGLTTDALIVREDSGVRAWNRASLAPEKLAHIRAGENDLVAIGHARIAVASANRVVAFDARSGARVGQFSPKGGRTTAIALSSGDDWLGIANYDGTVTVQALR